MAAAYLQKKQAAEQNKKTFSGLLLSKHDQLQEMAGIKTPSRANAKTLCTEVIAI